MITWYYDNMGNIAIWKGDIGRPNGRVDSDMYIQNSDDVEQFINHIGRDVNDIHTGDWDVCEDVGFFID